MLSLQNLYIILFIARMMYYDIQSRERECSRKPKKGTSRKCLSFAHQPLLESAGDCLDDEVTYQLQESIVHTEVHIHACHGHIKIL